jgi:hypothetical protein
MEINFMDNFIYRVKDWTKFQHYKKKNKNFNNEQPWFMFYGRRLLRDHKFMGLTIEQREFLIMCWAIGSQDNGFLPEVDQMGFLLNRSKETINQHLSFLHEQNWFETCSIEYYDGIQSEQEDIIHENRIERMKENQF